MSLLSDLYNTVAKFFRSTEETSDASKSVATNRLKLVLMQDRTNLTPRILEQMRSELIDLLSRYVELDKELLDLNFEQEGDQVALMLSIPVIRAKDEEEIDAAIKEHEEMLKAAAAKKEETTAEDDSESNEEQTGEKIVASSIDEIDLDGTKAKQEEFKQEEEKTEEERAEADKAEAIANELKEVPKIIKKKEKKEVSAPEEMSNSSNNPFKTETAEIDMIESTSES